MKALLLGLATYIMKNTLNSCFAETTRRMPFRCREIGPIPDTWKIYGEEFRKKVSARRSYRHAEQNALQLLEMIDAKSGASS